MSERVKLFIVGLLLSVGLGLAIFCTIQTVQAVQRFQRERQLAMAGDISTLRPWMTLPYISRVYNVPESYLYQWLHISNPQTIRHVSLKALASRFNRPLDALVKEVQTAILSYRKAHPKSSLHPAPTHGPPARRRKA